MFECWIKPLPKACFLIDMEGNDVCCPFLQLDENECICTLLKNGQQADNYKFNRKTLHRKPSYCPLQYAGQQTIKTVIKVKEVKDSRLQELETQVAELKETVRVQKIQLTKESRETRYKQKLDKLQNELDLYKEALENRVRKSCVLLSSSSCDIENKVRMTVEKELAEAKKRKNP